MGALFAAPQPQGIDLRKLYFGTPAPATIRAPRRTLTQTLNDTVNTLGQKVGLGKRMAGKVANLADLNPITPAFDAGSDLRKGNYVQGTLGALLSLFPDGGAAAAKGGAGLLHSIIAPLFHGSPHKFEKFALDKIGTGEGAQAYGHGLYFAENKDVAKEYQRQLAGDVFTTPDGYIYDPHSRIEHLNVRSTLNRTGNLDAAIAKAKDLLNAAPSTTREMLENDLVGLEWAKSRGGLRRPNGHLYEVKLDANPDQFLDWDAPLAQQPSGVADIYREMKRPVDQSYPGRTIYGDLNGMPLPVGSPYVGLGPSRAPQMLRDKGIPGVRYLDQGSRGAGKGTSNYVVFDPGIIDVLNRY